MSIVRTNTARWITTLLAASALVALGCEEEGEGDGESIEQIMNERNLSEDDVTAALQTYTPSGGRDPYIMFASGGHSGQVIVIGVPSMRILKYIAVFTPEPWQGYGFDNQTRAILRGGDRERELNWGDVHHPALSETNGEYDGQFLFVNDKSSGRVAVISLKDFSTRQIVSSPIIRSDHGGAFATPNTDYVIESSQYPVPLGGEYADVTEYNDRYRGATVFWKFDRRAGRIDEQQSFAMELPPYMQDVADVGKRATDGWYFVNSFNAERAIGGNMEGRPPLESGASQNDMDYLHVINWRRAVEVAQQPGKTQMINGFRVIPLRTAIAEGLIYLVPEPKSPHGVDITPDGADIVVNGKLDTHATVYSWEKMRQLIQNERFEGRDPYGVPILPFRESIRGQVELGLGPLHTQFDDRGNAYTSLFLESKVARWSVRDLRLIDTVPVHYNIGHLAVVEGDTVRPQGRFLVAMNKWALDRFNDVGPLLPQNFQLVDIGNPTRMRVLYDMPIPLGEPHYTQIIRADRLEPIQIYRPAGMDATTHRRSPNAVEPNRERVERREDGVHVYMTAVRSHFTPDTIRVRQGETVHLHITNVEQAHDATHGFSIATYDLNLSLEPGEHADVTFVADQAGVFPMYCTEFCSALHLEMAGYLLVEPAGGAGTGAAAPPTRPAQPAPGAPPAQGTQPAQPAPATGTPPTTGTPPAGATP